MRTLAVTCLAATALVAQTSPVLEPRFAGVLEPVDAAQFLLPFHGFTSTQLAFAPVPHPALRAGATTLYAPDPLLCSANYVGAEVAQLVFVMRHGAIVLLDASSSLALHALAVPASTWSLLSGICIDGEHEQVVLLDAAGPSFLRLDLADLRAGRAKFQSTPLPPEWSTVRGIAFDFARDRIVGFLPETGALLQQSATDPRTDGGTLQPVPEVLAFGFAPNGGLDHDLFIGSGDVRLLTSQWTWHAIAEVDDELATLRATVATSSWSPPSPDPSSITFDNFRDRLILADGEVDEMSIYNNGNIFESSRAGIMSRRTTTVSYSREPVGIAFQSATKTFYISDDDQRRVHVVTAGPDGLLHTSDDTRRYFSVSNFCADPEDVAFSNATNELWIAGGETNRVHRLRPGSNGIFDGTSPNGDDQLLTVTVSSHGVSDPEGIGIRAADGGVYVVGVPKTTLLHLNGSGQFVRTITLPSSGLRKPAGLVFAPRSSGTGESMYLVDRGVDNDSSPSENDGRMFEYGVPGPTPTNQAPVVNAGPDVTTVLTSPAHLAGTVTDDGLPGGPLTIQWTRLTGPGTASFATPTQAATNVTFSLAGSYTLQLSANDGALTTTDTVVVTVQSPPAGGSLIERTIATSDDDAEESSGSVSRTSTDLEMVVDGSETQTIGLRFQNLTIPAGSSITSANVQFTCDEPTTTATQLSIAGHASDNAPAFATTAGNISGRPRTAATVAWTPASWNVTNEAGLNQRTPNLASVVQQITNRPGWSSGNAIVFVITGTGTRIASAYDRGPATAPKLVINYQSTPPANQAPVVNAGPDVTVLLTAAATLAGTVSDDGLPSGTLTRQWSKLSGPGTVTFTTPTQAATNATFSAAGTYNLQLSANDGALVTTDTVIVTVQQPPPSSGLVERTIATGDDDAEEQPGAVSLASSDLEMVLDDTTSQTVGLRFQNLTIPAGSFITSAYVQFTCDEPTTDATQLTIAGHASDNAPGFAATAGNISSRPRTTATVAWAPVSWIVGSEAGLNQRTPNLASVVQQITNRPGWTSGNAIAFVITGTGTRIASAFEDDPAVAPKLVVNYQSTPPVNQAPVVNAGPDVTTLLSAAATLAGTVTDDGLPGPLTIQWSKLSGPGTVTFTAATLPVTNATFSLAGSYTLQLSANDGALTTTDTVVVTVQQTPVGGTVERGIATSDDDAEEQPGSVSRTSSDLELVLDGSTSQTVGLRFQNLTIPPGVVITSAYVQFTTDEATTTPTLLTIAGQASDNAPTFAGTAGNISSRPRTPATVSWAPASWTAGNEAGPNQRTPNLASVVQQITNRPGWVSGNAIAFVITGTGSRIASAFDDDPEVAPRLSVSYQVNQPPIVGAGPDVTILLPAPATLAGTVTDDGLLGPLTIQWSQLSGPGTASFTTPASATTNASFSAPGSYTLQLSANDGEFTITDTVVVTVQQNQPPVVNAGPDVTILLPAAASLAGTVTDDGLPGPLTIQWSKLSGPGTTTFTAPTQAVTSVSFSAPGSYTLQLSANDGEFTITDTVVVTVQQNQPPVVNAGPDATIVLPAAASLAGTVTDDGLLGPLTIQWSQLSGPGTASFTAPTQAITNVSFSALGSYTLQLSANDGEFTTTDTVVVTVQQNQPPVVNAGPDVTILLPAAASLAGTVTDDGLPGPLTIQWSKLTGPGTASFTAPTQAITNASFSAPGSYTLQLSANDGEFTITDTVVVTVQQPPILLERTIATSNDDAEESPGSVNRSSSDLEMVLDGSETQVVGLRFQNVTIPPGAVITSAYVQFTCDETTTTPTQLTIAGQASDNALTFGTTALNISSRPRTTATVAWAPVSWTVTNQAGPNQRTPNLASVVQEIANRPGWSSGNAIVFVITGSGCRIASAYDDSPAVAPKLIVNYLQ